MLNLVLNKRLQSLYERKLSDELIARTVGIENDKTLFIIVGKNKLINGFVEDNDRATITPLYTRQKR